MLYKKILPIILLIVVISLVLPIVYQYGKIKNTFVHEILVSKYFIFNDHHEILNIIDDMIQSGDLNTDSIILLNVDYHPDVYFNEDYKKEAKHVGNWINYLISEGKVKEVYWIHPDECLARKCTGFGHDSRSTDHIFYVDQQSKNVFYEKPSNTEGLSEVLFHRRILSDFPSISANSDLILSIDADFFDPFDGTDLSVKNTRETLMNKLDQFSEVVKKSGMTPTLVGWSRSKEYTSGNFNEELENYFNNLHLILNKN